MAPQKNRKFVGVKSREVILLLLIALTFSLSLINSVNANLSYAIQKEYARVEINKDGTINLFYNLTVLILPGGDPQRGIYLRMPNENIVAQSAVDEQGRQLICESETAPYSRLKILWDEAIGVLKENSSIRVNAYAFINANMFYNDTETNPGNVAMKFTPAWWDDVTTATDLELHIILPEGVNIYNTKYSPQENAMFIQDNYTKTDLFWTENTWSVNDQFETMVSFPANFMDVNIPLTPEGQEFNWNFIPGIIIGVLFLCVLAYIIYKMWRRHQQVTTTTTTTSTTTTTGRRRQIRQDLTPVEAAVLLNYNQEDVIKMMIFLMAKKGVIILRPHRPVKIERTDSQVELKYYEQEIIQAIRVDGTLNSNAFPRIYENLRWEVNRKMSMYDAEATRNQYRNLVEQRMEMVEASNIQLED